MSNDAQSRYNDYGKRTLTPQACDSCIKSKRKCDGQKPCHQCQRKGQLNCEYKRPRMRIISSRRRNISPVTVIESSQLQMTIDDSATSIAGPREVPSPPFTCISADTLNKLDNGHFASSSSWDSQQADLESIDRSRRAAGEVDVAFSPISEDQMELESIYLDSSMMDLNWLFGDSNSQGVPVFNPSGLRWNISQAPAVNHQQPAVDRQAAVQLNSADDLELMRVENPSQMPLYISNTPPWPTDYLSNVDDSDQNQQPDSASRYNQGRRYGHESMPARFAQSKDSFPPQSLGRIAIEGRLTELPKYLDDESRKLISTAFWEKWIGCKIAKKNFDLELESVEPSVFIDHTLSHFFKSFNTIYPLIHRATFLKTFTSPFLLFAMSAAGALYSHINGSKDFSYDMAITLLGCLPQSIELNHYMTIRLSTHQAAMILHLLGYGSGDKTTIFKVRVGSGVAANIFHRANAFNSAKVEAPTSDARSINTEILWRRWIEAETKRRVSIFFMSKLAIISPLLSQPSLMSFANHSVKFPAAFPLWEAATSREWMVLRNEIHHPFENHAVKDVLRLILVTGSVLPSASLTSEDFYIIICGLQEEIWKVMCSNDSSIDTLNAMFFPNGREPSLGLTEKKRITDALRKWRAQFSRLPSASSEFERSFRCRSLVLWHSSMVRLHVDMESIQRAAGKNTTASYTTEIQQRISGPASQRGLRHAVWHVAQIHNIIEQSSLPREALDVGMLIGMLQAPLVMWWFSKQAALKHVENSTGNSIGIKEAPSIELTEIMEESAAFDDFLTGNYARASVGGILLGAGFRFLRNFWVKRLQESFFGLGKAMADVVQSLEI